MIDLASIPDALKEGENWPLLDLDPDWVWVSYDGSGRVVGMLIAAPCHGLAFLWRIKILPGAPRWTLGSLLRRFFRDMRKRGVLGYIAFLDANRPEEQALLRIAFKAGGMYVTATTLVCGSVNAKHVPEGG